MVLAVAASILAVSACKNGSKAAEEAAECTECTEAKCAECENAEGCTKTVEEAVEGAAEAVKGE